MVWRHRRAGTLSGRTASHGDGQPVLGSIRWLSPLEATQMFKCVFHNVCQSGLAGRTDGHMGVALRCSNTYSQSVML